MDDYASGFFSRADRLIGALEQTVHACGLEELVEIDHVCFKCERATRFVFVRTMLEPFAPFAQFMISGRRVAYFHFRDPILSTSIGQVHYFELADQKPHYEQKEGFDHVEVYSNSLSYSELISRVGRLMPLTRIERPHHLTHNADLGDGFTLKFSEGPLIEKIRREL